MSFYKSAISNQRKHPVLTVLCPLNTSRPTHRRSGNFRVIKFLCFMIFYHTYENPYQVLQVTRAASERAMKSKVRMIKSLSP